MVYYAVSDIHGFLTETKKALEEKGFFDDADAKLILCGDALDRGDEVNETVDFLIDLMKKDKLIYIRGNHEDLMEMMLDQIAESGAYEIARGLSHHMSNGTWDTALTLADMDVADAVRNPEKLVEKVKNSRFFKELLPVAIDYFETEKYIFTHGYIPCKEGFRGFNSVYSYKENWRDAKEEDWDKARWYNGMQFACKHKITEKGKTIVCGHYHTSYGHAVIGKTCSEYGEDADFSPFCAEGLMAIDGCTAYSGKVNCVKLEEK
ncbi:MAG: hypothetical protein E7613_02235 [Ruminococcaceae bacterium]|nr:hypothetical protein [Oscillospiraceae bacterium]